MGLNTAMAITSATDANDAFINLLNLFFMITSVSTCL